MTKISDGGPVHPVEDNDMFGGRVTRSSGISLRDAAALAALQGLCANPNVMSDIGYESHVVARAIAMADAFIAARETKET